MKYTLCFLFTPDLLEVCLQYQMHGPCKGTWNGVGGKLEETDLIVGYGCIREIKEEVGLRLSLDQIVSVVHCKFASGNELYVFGSICEKWQVSQQEDEPIEWFDVNKVTCEAWDSSKYAGEGNLCFYIPLALHYLSNGAVG